MNYIFLKYIWQSFVFSGGCGDIFIVEGACGGGQADTCQTKPRTH